MTRAVRVLLVTLLLLAGGTASKSQECSGCGPVEPDHGGCRECQVEPGTAVAGCSEYASDWGEPSWVCTGGTYCYRTANGSVCEPCCGELRCSSI